MPRAANEDTVRRLGTRGAQSYRRVDDRQVCIGLREVPERDAQVWFILLGEQAQRTHQADPLVEELPRPFALTDQMQRFDQPARTEMEPALATGQSVVVPVPVNRGPAPQLALNHF